MTSLAPEGPNAEQIQLWNAPGMGPKWVDLDERLNAMIGPLGNTAIDRAGVASGEAVLDVGCGCGNTTLELARRVGSSGTVTGIDISTVMLERARERIKEAGQGQVDFENADAQTHVFHARFDLVFSRFGVMFFADPRAAFANLRSALRPGGRLAFLCWQPVAKNPWMMVPTAAAASHVELPPPPEPNAPGPFAFGDDERVRGILEGAAFEDVQLEAYEEGLLLGGGLELDETIDFFVRGVGPLSRILSELTPEKVDRVKAAVREAIEPYQTDDGVRMPAATWIVTAKRSMGEPA